MSTDKPRGGKPEHGSIEADQFSSHPAPGKAFDRSGINAMDQSDLLFLEYLLADATEQYPGYVWLWDECKPVNDYYH